MPADVTDVTWVPPRPLVYASANDGKLELPGGEISPHSGQETRPLSQVLSVSSENGG